MLNKFDIYNINLFLQDINKLIAALDNEVKLLNSHTQQLNKYVPKVYYDDILNEAIYLDDLMNDLKFRYRNIS